MENKMGKMKWKLVVYGGSCCIVVSISNSFSIPPFPANQRPVQLGVRAVAGYAGLRVLGFADVPLRAEGVGSGACSLA